MSVINLKDRCTTDWDIYNREKKSEHSYIYFADSNQIHYEQEGQEAIDFTVGKFYWKGQTKIEIKNRVKIPPQNAILIEVGEEIGLPLNMWGIISGIGVNIFKGGIISSGKIDPGYKGKLKLLYYNASDKTIVFEPGDLLACASFFKLEKTMDSEYKNYHATMEESMILEYENPVIQFFKKEWYSIFATIIAIVSIIISLCR